MGYLWFEAGDCHVNCHVTLIAPYRNDLERNETIAIMMAVMAVRVFLFTFLFREAVCRVNVDPNMKSFSYAIKAGVLNSGEEQTLYEHNTGQPGVITEQWFTGYGMDKKTTIKIYIDGETEASLDFNLYLAHGIGFGDQNETPNVPWGTKRLGHEANNGAVYNTFRIPFGKSFRVTAKRPHPARFWYIIRGVENYPVVLGDLVLPPNARLKLYKRENVFMRPFEFLNMAHVTGSAGAVFLVTLDATSSDLTFLEGCFRAFIDGSNKTMWLSSGTEDFFLSAFYFEDLKFQGPNSGLTYIDKGNVSAYKFFENDPLLFSKSLDLWWRCSDVDITKDKHGCPNRWPNPSPYADLNQFYNKAKLSKEEKIAVEEIRKGLKKNKELPKNWAAMEKERIAKEGKPYVYATFNSTIVTTYTWVYEW